MFHPLHPSHNGVPQDSILGPLLFLIFINDIGFIPSLKFKPKLFSDDANVFISVKDQNELQVNCQDTLKILNNWIIANRLTLNLKKTCYMLFSTNSSSVNPEEFSLKIDSYAINRVPNIKFLGVIIDEKLEWSPHIEELKANLRRLVGIFYKISPNTPYKIMKLLYFALVHSKLIYGIEIYANTYLTNLHDLIILNNRI